MSLVTKVGGFVAVCIIVRMKFISNYSPPISTLGKEKIKSEAEGGSAVINDDSFQYDIKYWLIFALP